MRVKNYIVETERQFLTEGIMILKNSKRFRKLAKKIDNQIHKAETITQKDDLKKTKEKIISVAREFARLETDYEDRILVKEKKAAEKLKAEYSKLETKYKDLVNTINKESVINALKVGGIAFLVIRLVLFGGMFIFTLGDAAAQMSRAATELGGIPRVLDQFFGKKTIFDYMSNLQKSIFGIGALGLGVSALIKLVSSGIARIQEKRLARKTVAVVKKIFRKGK